MLAKFIFTLGAVVFLVAAIVRILKDKGSLAPQSKTWLIMGGILTAVSIWLWVTGNN